MAVTKIRKMSSWTLLIVSIISLVVLGMFYAGGVVDPSVVWQFITLLQTNAKSAITSLIVIVVFAAILFITYSMGDATPLGGMNADSQKYNIPLWLKVTDMWIMSTVVLMVLIVAAVVWGSVKRMLNR